MVSQQTYSATRLRLFHRILGTLTGVIAGFLLLNLLPTTQGQIIVLLSSIYAFFYWVKSHYTYAVVFITVFVLASFNIAAVQGFHIALFRIIDTLIGAVLTFITVRFIWPDWQYKQLPALLQNAIVANKKYFDSIYQPGISDDAYIAIRRNAHHADSALTMAWKGMLLEPKKKRIFQSKAFNLTYLNHTILSYISAFGAHKFETENTASLQFHEQISRMLHEAAIALSPHINNAASLHKAKAIEENLFSLKYVSDKKEVTLFHNLARTSMELLAEAIALKNDILHSQVAPITNCNKNE